MGDIRDMLDDPGDWSPYKQALANQPKSPIFDAGELALMRIERLKEAIRVLTIQVDVLTNQTRPPQN